VAETRSASLRTFGHDSPYADASPAEAVSWRPTEVSAAGRECARQHQVIRPDSTPYGLTRGSDCWQPACRRTNLVRDVVRPTSTHAARSADKGPVSGRRAVSDGDPHLHGAAGRGLRSADWSV
jgi:hypothetical protein